VEPVARRTPLPGRWRRAVQWISTRLTSQAQTVPEGLRTCEFDCEEPFCSSERWHTCERRLSLERNPFVRTRG
jgi:hypothetical protein